MARLEENEMFLETLEKYSAMAEYAEITSFIYTEWLDMFRQYRAAPLMEGLYHLVAYIECQIRLGEFIASIWFRLKNEDESELSKELLELKQIMQSEIIGEGIIKAQSVEEYVFNNRRLLEEYWVGAITMFQVAVNKATAISKETADKILHTIESVEELLFPTIDRERIELKEKEEKVRSDSDSIGTYMVPDEDV